MLRSCLPCVGKQRPGGSSQADVVGKGTEPAAAKQAGVAAAAAGEGPGGDSGDAVEGGGQAQAPGLSRRGSLDRQALEAPEDVDTPLLEVPYLEARPWRW